ncbi:signaling lymphocytic activation molecule-like isoform X2 [Phaenicophaeus curvirostris]|uniref:signaling lymphocytic activation molecule-like isoform X2 n=1 Tax=Phaenicophaeus curvirostris TaxID=33595 RepID=UPI0037F0E892
MLTLLQHSPVNQGMGGSACLCLLISLGCIWGRGHGVRETVLGTLGKVTILWIPRELQDLTRRFGAAAWKRHTEDPQSKLILLKYSEGNCTNYMEGRARFHKLNFSLEILNTSRQDRQVYEYIVSRGPVEKFWQIKLEVYEPVSNPRIQILNRTLAGSSCTVTLSCSAERGDNVSYSWGSRNTNTSGLCSHNSSILHLSYPLHNASITCTCTASNPVSSQVVIFNSSECSSEQGGSAGLRTEHLVLVVVVPVIIIIIAIVLSVRSTSLHSSLHRATQEHSRLTKDSTVHTIYSQVQRVEKPRGVPAGEQPSCTTIYAAATGLPPDTASVPRRAQRPPRSAPTIPPTLQHSPLSQSSDKEPTTVYASVMMPTA